jgi:hypothetical protein
MLHLINRKAARILALERALRFLGKLRKNLGATYLSMGWRPR